MFKWFKKKKTESKQGTFIYCPNCDNELISSHSFVKDEELVSYCCKRCGTETDWLFAAPAPILMYVDGERYKHKPM